MTKLYTAKLWNLICILPLLIGFAANAKPQQQWPINEGIFTVYHPKAYSLVNVNAKLEVLATGFEWLEGPVWVEPGQYLLFSDIPNDKVYRWQQSSGVQPYLTTSGFSNGLKVQKQQLLLMQSRRRVVAKMVSSLDKPKAEFEILASHYQGKKLNSPNDAALHSTAGLFFTDPPYGLPKQMQDPEKELAFQGVYQLLPTGELRLIDKSLNFPNGIALSPDEKWLYVAVSDHAKPAWYRYQLDESGKVIDKSLFYQPPVTAAKIGVPDGLKVHSSGAVFATGAGGVWIFDQDKTLLAKINMPGFTANLAFDGNENTLFFTADNELRKLNLSH
ncbi:SMP-30/gluconolactonase/LRE family protein [Thalassotalea sp. PLHSN55]|uniref:SMP-30/gluconolactonase/LRE family protein n=1 Tax=Thalassotalea sp. PLHSN55 TaxID=3435888 RepID=UPI003F83CD85